MKIFEFWRENLLKILWCFWRENLNHLAHYNLIFQETTKWNQKLVWTSSFFGCCFEKKASLDKKGLILSEKKCIEFILHGKQSKRWSQALCHNIHLSMPRLFNIKAKKMSIKWTWDYLQSSFELKPWQQKPNVIICLCKDWTVCILREFLFKFLEHKSKGA